SYARKLSRTEGLSTKIVDPEPITKLVENEVEEQKFDKPKPKSPAHPTKIAYDEEIATKLEVLNNFKLRNLYFSICDISLKNHTPLIAVGILSFMESLAKKMGATGDFYAFFNAGRLSQLGLGDKQ